MAFGWKILSGTAGASSDAVVAPPSDKEADRFATARRNMVNKQLRCRDITDTRVLTAMACVPREKFLPGELLDRAYDDCPLPIGHGQTISQPYVVALTAQLANPPADGIVLEVGLGSGYQAVILSKLCKKVYGLEIVENLADSASQRLAALGIENVEVHCVDGYRGWPEHAPYDAIIVSAAPDHIPPPLIEQLNYGGHLIVPVGRGFQDLMFIEKRHDGVLGRKNVVPVQFVPMTGEAEHPRAF